MYINYSNCWEDTDILIKAINIKENGTYLSVASGGDNTFAMLAFRPYLVVAVDFNIAQIALVELKKKCIEYLDYEEALEFLGIKISKNRDQIFQKLKDHLSPASISFFLKNYNLILNGVIHSGKFEKYFNIFRKYILSLFLDVSNSRKVDNFMNDIELRREFFYKKVNSKIGRLIFKTFFSNQIMGLLGREKSFFKYSNVNLAQEILNRIETGLIFTETKDNLYLEYIFKGNFERNLPYYLKPEIFVKIKGILKDNPNIMNIYYGSLKDAIRESNNLKFDGFNLSDVFEYMNQDEYIEHLSQIREISNKGARLVYWNMIVDRNTEIEEIKNLNDLANELFKTNKSFFYRRLVIQEIK
jgi:S-adenosylmethionine-diacylglycerol 3-amino-3-carboxypropyl transferase